MCDPASLDQASPRGNHRELLRLGPGLVDPLGRRVDDASRHENAGLISRGRDAQWRPARLEAARLRDAAKWMERYRIFWEQSLDRLDAHLRELQGEDKRHGRRK